MLDMTHSTFPDYSHSLYSEAYWQEAVRRPSKLDLALESEFGKSTNQPASKFMVFEDAAKLAVVRAKVKVLVFGTVDGSARQTIVDTLAKLRSGADDPAPWLWIDLPWKAGTKAWTPDFGTIEM